MKGLAHSNTLSQCLAADPEIFLQGESNTNQPTLSGGSEFVFND